MAQLARWNLFGSPAADQIPRLPGAGACHWSAKLKPRSHWSNMRPLSVEENREKNGHFDEDELRQYKEAWSENFGRRPKFPKRAECPF
jgi:hypothetical protein